jgi:hypothetical protein
MMTWRMGLAHACLNGSWRSRDRCMATAWVLHLGFGACAGGSAGGGGRLHELDQNPAGILGVDEVDPAR